MILSRPYKHGHAARIGDACPPPCPVTQACTSAQAHVPSRRAAQGVLTERRGPWPPFSPYQHTDTVRVLGGGGGDPFAKGSLPHKKTSNGCSQPSDKKPPALGPEVFCQCVSQGSCVLSTLPGLLSGQQYKVVDIGLVQVLFRHCLHLGRGQLCGFFYELPLKIIGPPQQGVAGGIRRP